MSKIKKVELIVKDVLEETPDTRKDDFLLVAEVYYKLRPDIIKQPFNIVMLGHKDYGLPYFESITRARRKLQAENEHLRPPKEVQEARLNETSEYINYAIDGYTSNFMKFVDASE